MASVDILNVETERFLEEKSDGLQFDYPDFMETYGLKDDINDLEDSDVDDDEDDDDDSSDDNGPHSFHIPHEYDDIITPRHHVYTPEFSARNVDDIVEKYLGPLGGEHLRRPSPTCDCCEPINEINFEHWKKKHGNEAKPILKLPRIRSTSSATHKRPRKPRTRRTVSFNEFVERTTYTPEPPMRELFSETQILPSHEVIMDSRQITEPDSSSKFLPNYFTDSADVFTDAQDSTDSYVFDAPPKSSFKRSSTLPSFTGLQDRPAHNVPNSKVAFDRLIVEEAKPTFNRSSSLPSFPRTPVRVNRGYIAPTPPSTGSKAFYKPLTSPHPLTPDTRPILLPELKMAPRTPPEVAVLRHSSVADNVVKASSRYDEAMEKLGQKLQTAFS